MDLDDIRRSDESVTSEPDPFCRRSRPRSSYSKTKSHFYPSESENANPELKRRDLDVVSKNWASDCGDISFPKNGLDYSLAKLNLSPLNGKPLPSFTFDNGRFPSRPRKNSSFPSVSNRTENNSRVKGNPSFTSLPGSKGGCVFDSPVCKPGTEHVPGPLGSVSPFRGLRERGQGFPPLRESDEEESHSPLTRTNAKKRRAGVKSTPSADEVRETCSLRLNKYEIPSFYVFRPLTNSSGSNASSADDQVDENYFSVEEDESKDDTRTVETVVEDRPAAKTVNKFTLSKLKDGSEREGTDTWTRKRSGERGQGDTPWILLLDGSDESEEGETWLRHDQYDVIESLEHEATQLHNNLTNAALHQNKRGQSEGKISRFFSRLRKSPSSCSAQLRSTQPIESNGKEATSLIVNLQDNQSTSKKSKMCMIL